MAAAPIPSVMVKMPAVRRAQQTPTAALREARFSGFPSWGLGGFATNKRFGYIPKHCLPVE